LDGGNSRVDGLLDVVGVAAIVALATAFAMLGEAVLGCPPLVPLAVAVVASLALSGRRGAAAAVLFATLCTDFVFVAPRYHWTLNGTALVLGVYYIFAALGAAKLNQQRPSSHHLDGR
jgi:K+-sensing histidine kinase KdpD